MDRSGNAKKLVTTIGKDLEKAAELLLKGELVAIPTETVYGLAANALNEKAVEKIFLAKNRPPSNPLILHVAAIDQISEYAKEIPELALQLLDKYAPGPLTVLLPKREGIPALVNNGLPDIAIRIPNHSLTLDLLREIEVPLAAPSANPFGYISPTTPLHVKAMLGGGIEYILDGGACNSGLESTIIGFPKGVPTIYRVGMITKEDIEAIIGPVELNKGIKTVAPGMLLSHYAPKTPLYLTENISEDLEKFKDFSVGVITYNSKVSEISPQRQMLLCQNNEFTIAAKNLYAFLHQMDKEEYEIILVQKFPSVGIGNTLNDRLQRASIKTH